MKPRGSQRVPSSYAAPEHDDTDPFPYDPSKPPHPIFNLPPAERMAQHLRNVEYRERKPFPEWDEVVRRVRAKEFTSKHHLANVYRKGWNWAARITALMVKQGVFTGGELKAAMSKKASQYDPSLTSSRTVYGGRLHALSRGRFESVCTAYDLSFALVVRMLRAGYWGRTQDFEAHFNQPKGWAQAFRRLLLRELVMTPNEWWACWLSLRLRPGKLMDSSEGGKRETKK